MQCAMGLIFLLEAGPLLAVCLDTVRRHPVAIVDELYGQHVFSTPPRLHTFLSGADGGGDAAATGVTCADELPAGCCGISSCGKAPAAPPPPPSTMGECFPQ